MKKIITLNEARIMDNLFEGYPVKLIRTDGWKLELSMKYNEKGDTVFFVKSGRATINHGTNFDGLMSRLNRFEYTNIEY
ncbi:MAG: hypothetical protein LUC18_00055 [Porphyromonadaceae bacterium]|nr:hypothetical protein [Porphyromonadaceae bacterium]